MKRSIRLPFSLILLVAVLTLLSSRAALRRRLYPAPAPSPLNSTLLRLAAADPSEPDLRRDVNELLDGNLASSSSLSGRHRSISLYRRTNDHHPRHPIRLRSPRDSPVVLPEFRRALRDWFRRRQYQASVMSDLLSQIKPRTSPATADRRYSTCAVVGNSGILLQRHQGGLIDSHDLVVRLNNARVEGYQRSVGAKTDISFVNSNILHLCARRESCFCHPYGEAVPIVMYICQPVHFLDYAACNSSHKSPLIVTDPRFDLLASRIVKYYSLKLFVDGTGKAPEEWGKAHNEKMFHYSSGMQAVLLAVGICDQVSVFGFGKSDGAKHHYHTNQKAELDLHDYEAEYAFYHDLVDRPQVIPFLGDSGFKVPPVVFYH